MKATTFVPTCLLIILLFFFFSSTTYGQPQLKTDKIKIINGKLWTPQFTNANGDQFFSAERNLFGKLLLEGIWHSNCKFLYDTELDQVITTIPSTDKQVKNIVVNRNRLEGFAFTSSGRDYLFLRGNKIHNSLKPLHYYQVYRTPSINYAIRWRKTKNIATKGIREFNYEAENQMCLILNRNVIYINNKRQLLMALADKKSELKVFIRQKRIKIKPKSPLNMVLVIQYYDQLCKKN